MAITRDDVDIQKIESIATGIRRRVLEHTLKNNGGYMSQACSAAEILGSVYGGMLDLGVLANPMQPSPFMGTPGIGGVNRTTGGIFHGEPSANRDRFIVSPAHYALVVYTALIETGRLAEGALDQFNKDGSTVEMIGAEHSPGFESTTGSLSQALSQGIGLSLARRMKGETGRNWVFMSDGEFQEGQTWEALQVATHYKLDTLRIIVDVNQTQCDGPMEDVLSIEPLADKVRAFGWDVHHVDGHDIDQIVSAGTKASSKPLAILCYTDPARGLPILNERYPVLHYLRFKSEQERNQYEAAYEEMTK